MIKHQNKGLKSESNSANRVLEDDFSRRKP